MYMTVQRANIVQEASSSSSVLDRGAWPSDNIGSLHHSVDLLRLCLEASRSLYPAARCRVAIAATAATVARAGRQRGMVAGPVLPDSAVEAA
jgi:hypothetical protein